MLKQDLLDLIAANLETGSNITAAEHRAVEEAIVDYVGFDMVAYGRIGPIDITGSSSTYDVNGDLVSAVKTDQFERMQRVLVTIPSGLLSSTNFKVRVDLESGGTDNIDNDIYPVLFKKNGSSLNTFYLVLEENTTRVNVIYIHLEVIQL
jgi:hypothetical protein